MKRLLVSLAVLAVFAGTAGDALAKKQSPRRLPVVVKNDRQEAIPISVVDPIKVELSGHQKAQHALDGHCTTTRCDVACTPAGEKENGLFVTLGDNDKVKVFLAPSGRVAMVSTRYKISGNGNVANWSVSESWSCSFPGVVFTDFTPPS